MEKKSKYQLYKKICKMGDFDTGQKIQIWTGIFEGLTEEQVMLYASLQLDKWDMEDIRMAFQKGISKDEIALALQIKEKYNIFLYQATAYVESKLPVENLEILIKQNYDEYQKRQILKGLQGGLTVEQIQKYSNPIYSPWNMEYIREALLAEWPDEQIKLLQDENECVCELYYRAIENKIDLDKVKDLIPEVRKKYRYCCNIENIVDGIQKGLTKEQILIYASCMYLSKIEVDNLISGFKNGLTKEKILLYARTDERYDFGREESIFIYNCIVENTLSFEQLKFLVNNYRYESQMREVKNWFDDGFSIDEINKHIGDVKNVSSMIKKRYKLSVGKPRDKIRGQFLAHKKKQCLEYIDHLLEAINLKRNFLLYLILIIVTICFIKLNAISFFFDMKWWKIIYVVNIIWSILWFIGYWGVELSGLHWSYPYLNFNGVILRQIICVVGSILSIFIWESTGGEIFLEISILLFLYSAFICPMRFNFLINIDE